MQRRVTKEVYSNSELAAYIRPYIPQIQPPGFTITAWNVDVNTIGSIESVPSGAFRGMQSDARNVQFWLTLKQNSSGKTSSLHIEGRTAAITFTQFSAFSFSDFNIISGVNSLDFIGRVHTNGDFCAGGVPNLKATYLTVAGKIYHPNTGGGPCVGPYGFVFHNYVSDGSVTPPEILKTALSGCTNCGGSGLNWAAYALARWNGHLQDVSFGVPPLNLPISSQPLVQNLMTTNTIYPNDDERFLIDPLIGGEPEDVKTMKFAYKADIRIINGVWYLKNPANINDWPGIPIWSDHPGHFGTTNEEGIEGVHNVGQSDIAAWFIAFGSATGIRWASEAPKKFSFYEINPTTNRLNDNAEGIISYGNVFRSGVNQYIPGFYNSNTPTNNVFCPGEACTDVLCAASPNLVHSFQSPMLCASGNLGASRPARIINATRSGFRYGIFYTSSLPAGERGSRANILPMNFDLRAFQDALSCNFDPANPLDLAKDHPGELGCYFKTTGLMGRPFNGIIYITNTWKNQMQGLTGGTYGGRPPHQLYGADAIFAPATNSDTDQVNISHPAQQRALPFELCSSSVFGQNFDADGFFKIPDCARYDLASAAANKLRTRPSYLRILNASNLNIPLSIVSNLDIFLQGDINTSSDTSTALASPWQPLLIAGNQLIPLSGAWSDDSERWDVAPSTLAASRIAADTHYNFAMMGGQFPFLPNENWAGKTMFIRSPLLMPYSANFDNLTATVSVGDNTWRSGPLDMKYDPHFEALANQPPGIPFMNIFAITGWQKK